jgi:hypothetical protein
VCAGAVLNFDSSVLERMDEHPDRGDGFADVIAVVRPCRVVWAGGGRVGPVVESCGGVLLSEVGVAMHDTSRRRRGRGQGRELLSRYRRTGAARLSIGHAVP